MVIVLKFIFSVVAIDMRGYGDSSRPTDVSRYGVMTLVKDIAECIDKLGHDKAIVVGKHLVLLLLSLNSLYFST